MTKSAQDLVYFGAKAREAILSRGVLPRGVSSSYTGKRKKGKVENV
jgi:hypothetical protein